MNLEISQFPTPDQKKSWIRVAAAFFNMDIPGNEEGYLYARGRLTLQHRQTLPAVPDKLRLFRQIAQDTLFSHDLAQQTVQNIQAGRYPEAVNGLNHLNYFAEIAFNDQIGDQVLVDANKAHRLLCLYLLNNPTTKSITSPNVTENIRAYISRVRGKEESINQLHVMRNIIHKRLLEGSIDESAKCFFDPYAVISV